MEIKDYKNWRSIKRDNCTYIVGDVAFEYNDEIYHSGENGDRACIPTKVFTDFSLAYDYWLANEKQRHLKDELRNYCYGVSEITSSQDSLDDFLYNNGFSGPIDTYIDVYDKVTKQYKITRIPQILDGMEKRLQHILDCSATSDIRKDWTDAQWDEYLSYFRLRFSVITALSK